MLPEVRNGSLCGGGHLYGLLRLQEGQLDDWDEGLWRQHATNRWIPSQLPFAAPYGCHPPLDSSEYDGVEGFRQVRRTGEIDGWMDKEHHFPFSITVPFDLLPFPPYNSSTSYLLTTCYFIS